MAKKKASVKPSQPAENEDAASPDRLTDQPATESAEETTTPTRYVLVMYQSPFGVINSMNHRLFVDIQDILDETVESSPEDTSIDVWIESPGGSANVAYKIALELRSRAHQLHAVVPDYAKSAATLLLLGFDHIYMDAAAELGPLDVQVEHPDRENVTVSGLDMAKALGFLSEFSAEFILQSGADIIDATKLSRETVLERFSHFVATFLEPVVAKLDPQLIHKASNDLDLATKYATTLLANRNVPEDHELASPEHLASHLVNHYPAHEFAISREEARGIGLPVSDVQEYDLWNMAKHLHRKFRKQLFSDPRTDTVFHMFNVDDVLNDEPPTEGHDDAETTNSSDAKAEE
ncbi:MAG: hypothetical protein H8E66_00145 [Planctomycetes bacterium]|nr:hypothetical protein [Planctomycetota bacterium]